MAALPTVMDEGWAPGLSGAAEFWLPLWRFLARGAGERFEDPRLSVVGDDLVLELGAATAPWPPEVRVEFKGSGTDGDERVMGGGTLGLGAGGVPGVMRRRVGPLGELERGGGGVWRAHLSDGLSGDSLGVLPFVVPLAPEFRPFTGALLPLGVQLQLVVQSLSPSSKRGGFPLVRKRAPVSERRS